MTLPALTTPFVSLKVGDMELGNVNLVPGERDPKYFQSFKITRISTNSKNDEVVGYGLAFLAEFSFTMIDDLDLERKLLEYVKENGPDPKVTFQYGIVGERKSPVYSGVITKLGLSSDFYTLTMTISPDGVSSVYRNYKSSTWDSISNKVFSRPSDLVQAIADGQGWDVGNIERTKEVSGGVRLLDMNTGPYQFIKSNLLKGVLSEKGEGSYVSDFVVSNNGLLYYYEPTKFLVNRYNYKNLKSYNFSINLDPDGEVIRFRPTLFDGMVEGMMMSAKEESDPNKTSSKAWTIARDTKEVVSVDYNLGNTGNSSSLNPEDEVTMAYNTNMMINSDSSDIQTYGEGSIKDDINSYAYSTALGSKANLVIVGDPDLQVLDYINVIPMYPMNDSSNSSGIMHPSGGTYQIVGVVDEISSTFTTSLELVKMNDTYNISEIDAKNASGGAL